MTFRPTALASIFVLSLSGCIINVNCASMEPLEHSQQVMQLDASGLNTMVVNTKGLTILEAGSGNLSFDQIDGQVSMH